MLGAIDDRAHLRSRRVGDLRSSRSAWCPAAARSSAVVVPGAGQQPAVGVSSSRSRPVDVERRREARGPRAETARDLVAGLVRAGWSVQVNRIVLLDVADARRRWPASCQRLPAVEQRHHQDRAKPARTRSRVFPEPSIDIRVINRGWAPSVRAQPRAARTISTNESILTFSRGWQLFRRLAEAGRPALSSMPGFAEAPNPAPSGRPLHREKSDDRGRVRSGADQRLSIDPRR